MKIAEQLKFVRNAFEKWARENKAVVQVATDAVSLVGLLRTGPGRPRAVVLFNDERKRGEYEEAGMVDREFWVVVSMGKGLPQEPGASLVDGSAGGKPLYEVVEDAREIVRGLSFDAETTEVTPDYKGATPFKVDGFLLDAMQITFTIGTALPGLGNDPEAPVDEGVPQ